MTAISKKIRLGQPCACRGKRNAKALLVGASLALGLLAPASGVFAQIGQELTSYERLEDGEEFTISVRDLIRRGELAFRAQWTPQQGGGRPFSKGVGAPLSDFGDPLLFPRNFNRVSSRDANSCDGCHNAPFGIPGGGGDFVTGVFVAAQRFDFATFDHNDPTITKGAVDESGAFALLQTMGNYRATLGMFGSGFVEMLARQMTIDLQSIRDATPAGASSALTSKGVSFGTITRDSGGAWDVSLVEGLPAQSLTTTGPADPPSLIIHPFHQSGSVVSIRQFTNNAYNHHHGMQSAERFGYGVDADGDGFTNELTRADITAVTVFQATLPPPGQVIPLDNQIATAIADGNALFGEIGCASCHIPALPLDNEGWIYTEPNPFNPPGNLQVGEAETLRIDLTRNDLPGQRLRPRNGVVWVPAFTDLKLHDITSSHGDPNAESIDINQPGGSPGFFAGNRSFLTKK
ncbi:MAG: thiol oxidoreductase, partial [Gammaproteobacteria bacterium]|nr:thiol oxidoreductase [Gammaproteobacteria bacterium]